MSVNPNAPVSGKCFAWNVKIPLKYNLSGPMFTKIHFTVRVEKDLVTSQQLQPIKSCLAVFFMFLRKPSKSQVFTNDVIAWILRLVINEKFLLQKPK